MGWLVARWRVLVASIGLLAAAGVGAGWLHGYVPLRITTAAAALALAVASWRTVLALLISNVTVMAFLVWSALSLIWSVSELDSATTFVGLISVAVFACALVDLDRSVDVQRLMMWLFTGTSALSMLLVFVAPAISTVVVRHPTEGLLVQPNGVFIWNSDFGFSAGLAALLATRFFFEKLQWRYLAVIAANVAAMVMSNAVASLVVFGAGLLFLLLVYRRALTLIALGIVALVATVAAIALGPDALLHRVFALVGRSPDLTGRVALWMRTLEEAQVSLFMGRGLGVEPNFRGLSAANHAHNGFIQVLFDRGVIGLVLIAAVVVLAIIGAVRRRDAGRGMILVVVIVANLANDYLSFASLGLILLFWVSYSFTPLLTWIRSRLGGGEPGSAGIQRSAGVTS